MEITQPTEVHFDKGIWAWDAANKTWVQLQIDTTDGSLHVAVKEAVLPTGAASEATLKTRFGYSDAILDTTTLTVTVPGTNNLTFTAVPADTVHVITNIAAICSTTNPNQVDFYILRSATAYALQSQALPTAWFWLTLQGWWVLKAGDQLRVTYTTCLANDVLVAEIAGFAMDIS